MVSGKLLHKLRKQNDISVDYIKDKLHVSKSTIYRWEREDSLNDKEIIQQYAELLGVSTTYLTTGVNDSATTECAITEAEPEPATPAPVVKKPLSLLKIGLISAASAFLIFAILASVILICIYFQPTIGNGNVHFWIITAEEIFVIIAIAFLGTVTVTTITVLSFYLVRRNRNKRK